MENKLGKVLSIATLVVAVAVLIVVSWPDNKLGTSFTMQTSNGSYTDSADLRQNVQALTERMAGLSQYQILQADSKGVMQAVAPSALAGTSWDLDGLRTASFVQTGAIATFATTSAATTAQVCDNPVWTSTSNGATTTTITLPATTTLFADCLTTNGDTVSFSVINTDTVTSTILAAGAGGTALYENSLTIAAGKAAFVKIVRDATLTYKALIVSLDN